MIILFAVVGVVICAVMLGVTLWLTAPKKPEADPGNA